MVKFLNYISAAIILGAALTSCSDDRYIISPDGEPVASRNSVRAQIANAHEIGDEMLYNIRPYIFNGEDNSLRGEFYGVPNTVLFPGHYVDMAMRPGIWDLTLVTCPNKFWQNLAVTIPGVTDLQDVLEQPKHGVQNTRARMYRHRAVNGVFPDFKDFYTAIIKGVEVKNVPEGLVNEYTSPVYFLRNYCKVRVQLNVGERLSLDSAAQSITLSHIPEALNWTGGLYPSASTPDISPAPTARGYFETEHYYTTTGSDGLPVNVIHGTNELVYYVPAHRGVDADTDNPTDTATSRINVNLSLKTEDNVSIIKNDMPIGLPPRPNTELLVKINYQKRQLSVTAEILPWVEDNAEDASMGSRHVKVDKPAVNLSYKDTIHIVADADYTVTRASDCNWITVTKLEDDIYEITADRDTYTPGSPRTSYINVTSGNYTKRIPVTQRPENLGSIKVHITGEPNTKRCWLSPPHPTKYVTVECWGGDWKTVPAVRLRDQKFGHEGVTDSVEIVRQVDTHIFYDEYDVAYGPGPVVFFNTTTLDTDTLIVDNLFIGADDDVVEIEQPPYPQTLAVETNHIVIYGGMEDCEIISLPPFISSGYFDSATKTFHFVSLSNPAGEDEWGTIILGHKDDPDYQVRLEVDQAIRIDIPEFDFFVVRYTWGSADVDIKVGFFGNPTSINYRDVIYPASLSASLNGPTVGWSRGSTTSLAGQTLLRWGGDATGGQGETVFFNAKQINAFPYPGGKDSQGRRVTPTTPNILPRVVTLKVGAGWYRGSGTCKVEIFCYLGGSMTQSGTNFYNNGGTSVYYTTYSNPLSGASVGSSSNNYTHLCDVNYDRKKHTASVTWDGAHKF